MPVGFSITAWHEGPGAHDHDGEIEGATAPGTHFPSALGSSPVGGPAAGLICGASIVIQQSGGGFGGPPQQSTVLQAGVADAKTYKRTELYHRCKPQCVFGGLQGDGFGGFRCVADGGLEHVPVLFAHCVSAGSQAAAKQQNEEYRYLPDEMRAFFGSDGVSVGFRSACPRACPRCRKVASTLMRATKDLLDPRSCVRVLLGVVSPSPCANSIAHSDVESYGAITQLLVMHAQVKQLQTQLTVLGAHQ